MTQNLTTKCRSKKKKKLKAIHGNLLEFKHSNFEKVHGNGVDNARHMELRRK
jgi:hypothetical protein